MTRSFTLPIAFIAIVALGGCTAMSPAEIALCKLDSARADIKQVNADRESAGRLVPIQRKICQTFMLLHDIDNCQLLIRPATHESETVHEDKSITYAIENRFEITALITINPDAQTPRPSPIPFVQPPAPWIAANIQEKLSSLLLDNGLTQVTLDLPIQSQNTWIITGWSPNPGSAPSTKP